MLKVRFEFRHCYTCAVLCRQVCRSGQIAILQLQQGYFSQLRP